MRKFKRERERLKNSYDTSDKTFRAWERHCLERMRDSDTESHKTRGTLFSPVTKQYASVQDRGEFVEWALSNEPELVAYKERAAELNALVRQLLDDGEVLPPGIGFYDREYISQRST